MSLSAKELHIRFARAGGPEVLEWVDVELNPPGPRQVLISNTAVAVN